MKMHHIGLQAVAPLDWGWTDPSLSIVLARGGGYRVVGRELGQVGADVDLDKGLDTHTEVVEVAPTRRRQHRAPDHEADGYAIVSRDHLFDRVGGIRKRRVEPGGEALVPGAVRRGIAAQPRLILRRDLPTRLHD